MEKVIREIVVKREGVKDIRGWGIQKGTRLFVLVECPPHPREGFRLLKVRVDNGTGMLDLCPETVVRDSEVEEGAQKNAPAREAIK